jgi:spore coat polysaccharide biosynthesis predicted glycosyltransferase SpsG/RimJ/RimL family protein N-acetyltransferase
MVNFGHQVFFISKSIHKREKEVLNGSGIESLELFDHSSSLTSFRNLDKSDAERTNDLVVLHGMELLVVDHYGAKEDWFDSLGKRQYKIVGISDFPANKEVDIVIDYGFDASNMKHQGPGVREKTYFLGPEFALIGSPPGEARPPSPALNERDEVLFSLGSGIPDKMIVGIVSEYEKRKANYPVRIISARAVAGLPEMTSTQLTISPDDIYKHYAESRFCITAGGLSLYERISMGIPGITFQSAHNQSFALAEAVKRGITKVFSLEEISSPKGMRSRIESEMELLNPESEYVRLRSEVDHKGPLRAAYLLGLTSSAEDSNFTSRTVQMSDAPVLLRWANEIETRQNSFQRPVIEPDEHLEWMKRILSQKSYFHVFYLHTIPIGYVRVQEASGEHVLSYGLDRVFRGQGLSLKMLNTALEECSGMSRVLAKTTPENKASIHVLLRAGFRVTESTNSEVILQLNR